MLRRTASKEQAPGTIPLDRCLAKTWRVTSPEGEQRVLPGRSVEEHSRIALAVAQKLLEVMPEAVRRIFPEYSEYVCGMHDIGKISPMFARKMFAALGMEAEWPQLGSVVPELEQTLGYHYSVSRACMARLLPDHPEVGEAVGWHHGRAPLIKPAEHTSYGGAAWQAMREELCRRINPKGLWPSSLSPDQVEILKGLVSVSDWIASGAIFDDPGRDWGPLVPGAVEDAGFRPLAVRHGLSFRDIFGRDPYPVQSMLAEKVSAPGVYVLEAPMGMGKTEAALYAAYRMLESGRASGIYFALPTQLTSNLMYDRMSAFLAKITESGSPVLLHGKAWLLRALGTLGDEAAPGKAWFCAAKRGLLAPFAVGTVDQALMSVIAVKHNFVRMCGLAGKVVILDEIHSYDDYTGTLLDVLVKRLESIGCTVIILSATLTRGRRASLLGMPAAMDAYPLVTARTCGVLSEAPCPPPPDRTVALNTRAEDDEAVEECLRRAEEGQQVLWIENTVDAAQDMYRLFAARAAACGLEAGLLHSRFTPEDRERNEKRWTTLYAAGRSEPAAAGRILVGTQVLEQSLDIDADFLVTRFCPADMLFQRLGRLWRGKSTLRPAGAACEAWILMPEESAALESPETAFGLSGVVYRPYVLARSLEVWSGRKSVGLPSDIRPMMEAVYAERPLESEPTDAMRSVRHDLDRERSEYRRKALAGTDSTGGMKCDEQASTRLQERPTVRVLMLESWHPAAARAVLPGGREISLPASCGAAQKAAAAAELEKHIVSFIQANKFKKISCISDSAASVLSRCLRIWRGDGGEAFGLCILGKDGTLSDESGLPAGVSYSGEIGLYSDQ